MRVQFFVQEGKELKKDGAAITLNKGDQVRMDVEDKFLAFHLQHNRRTSLQVEFMMRSMWRRASWCMCIRANFPSLIAKT
jgi:hypothetical protein